MSIDWERRTALMARRAVQNRKTLLAALRAAKVTLVTAEYDGQGDSGQVEDAVFTPPLTGDESAVLLTNDQNVAQVVLDVPLLQGVNELFYDHLETKYGGWENNEGAFGRFEWTIATDQLHWVHNNRYESVETYEEDL